MNVSRDVHKLFPLTHETVTIDVFILNKRSFSLGIHQCHPRLEKQQLQL